MYRLKCLGKSMYIVYYDVFSVLYADVRKRQSSPSTSSSGSKRFAEDSGTPGNSCACAVTVMYSA